MRFEPPGEECDEDVEPDRNLQRPIVPCDRLYWEVREEDTNGNGVFGPRDPVELLQFDPADDQAPHPVVSKEALAAADALLK